MKEAKDSKGFVTINDEPTKNRLHRFCEKKIDQWAQSQHVVDPRNDLKSIDFRVRFTEEEDTHQIGCETEIKFAGSTWVGYDINHDTQQAFIHSLKHLHAN
jgi:hypothetical protein